MGALAINMYFAFIGMNELTAILVAATALSVVGFIDDHRTLGPVIKLCRPDRCAVALWAFGTRIELTGFWPIDLGLTVFWVVAITNAFNLLQDNMDGLSAVPAAIAAGFFWIIAASEGQYLVGTAWPPSCAGRAWPS